MPNIERRMKELKKAEKRPTERGEGQRGMGKKQTPNSESFREHAFNVERPTSN
jgi:hypothetical protein